MDTIPERLPRAPGQVSRAAIACYAAAILHATVAVAVGLLGNTARTVAEGILVGVFGAVLWVAIGTGLALLGQIADRR
jgi:hypothetical protein